MTKLSSGKIYLNVIKHETPDPGPEPVVAMPFLGRFYGNPVYARAIGNNKVKYSYMIALRFRCQVSGRARAVKWEQRCNTQSGKAPNYSGGDGGKIWVELRKVRGTRLAGGVPDMSDAGFLAKTKVNDGFDLLLSNAGWGDPIGPNARPDNEVWDFISPSPLLIAGQNYALVWHNDRDSGWVSVNSGRVADIRANNHPPFDGNYAGPFYGDALLEMEASRGSGGLSDGDWRGYDRFNLNGEYVGSVAYQPYMYCDVIGTNDECIHGQIFGFAAQALTISSTNWVRQDFKTDRFTRKITGLWVPFYRKASPATLEVRIQSGTSNVIPVQRFDCSSLAESEATPLKWVKFPLPTFQLAPVTNYKVTMLTTGGSLGTQALHCLRDRNPAYTNLNHCWTKTDGTGAGWYSTNSGGSWSRPGIDYSTGTVSSDETQLSFAFACEPVTV